MIMIIILIKQKIIISKKYLVPSLHRPHCLGITGSVTQGFDNEPLIYG